MTRRRQSGRPAHAARRKRTGTEWVGGCLEAPFFITDREEPYRAFLVAWVEVPGGLVVGHDVVAPEDVPGSLGRTLVASMERPLTGRPRRPARVRVASASLAREVREVVGGTLRIVVAPTPELDDLIGAMRAAMTDGDAQQSYLEGGSLSADAVGELFAAAKFLYTAKPWQIATDDQVLRMDIPELGVEGACVSIIGTLGESLGLLIFPSLAGYKAFLSVAGRPLAERGPIDLGTDWLALSFAPGAELSDSMRREVAEHGWPVASAEAYPLVERRERDGTARPLVERDLQIAARCATSLSAFVFRHGAAFDDNACEPVCESLYDDNDLEVRFTIPYEAVDLFEGEEPAPATAPAAAAEPARFVPKVGRNDPCPCGSGRKYKKCHLQIEEADLKAATAKSPLHDLDARVVGALLRFAVEHFGQAWWAFEDDFEDAEEACQLAVPWSVYQFRLGDQTVLEAYLEVRGPSCSPEERDWLAAQQAAWLSVWEVLEVEPGETMKLRDLLSDEVRSVREASGSQVLVARDAILARVVDHQGVSLVCGSHPAPLPPLEAAEVIRRARGRLRRKRVVPPERLRDGAFGRYLIRRWEEAVRGLQERASLPPVLYNTDGDPFLVTTDYFTIEPDTRSKVKVRARLAGLSGAEPPKRAAKPRIYVFLRAAHRTAGPDASTVIGRAWLVGDTLHVETNSVERADALRERVEEACAGLIRHRAREHADPLSSRAARGRGSRSPEPLPPEAEHLVLEFKKRHYANWIDQPLPALDGKSPRQAAQTAPGRTVVDVLLKDMENREQRALGATLFDFSEIRRRLRLE